MQYCLKRKYRKNVKVIFHFLFADLLLLFRSTRLTNYFYGTYSLGFCFVDMSLTFSPLSYVLQIFLRAESVLSSVREVKIFNHRVCEGIFVFKNVYLIQS